MKIIFLNTETTGLDPKARLVQLVYRVHETKEALCELYKPPCKIDLGAMMTHNITHEMVEEKETFAEGEDAKKLQTLLNENILVAHNAKFTINILKNEGIETKWFIDTLQVAQHLLESDSYKLQYLGYSLKLKTGEGNEARGTYKKIAILEKLFHHLFGEILLENGGGEREVIKQMVTLTKSPVFIRKFVYGKYKGKSPEEVAQIDRSYLLWMLDSQVKKPQSEQDNNLIFTLTKILS